MKDEPLFKVGDIVTLKPYNDFTEHLSIRKDYWNFLADKRLEIKVVDTLSVHDIYYGFSNARYGWSERFLKPFDNDFLSDKDFDI